MNDIENIVEKIKLTTKYKDFVKSYKKQDIKTLKSNLDRWYIDSEVSQVIISRYQDEIQDLKEELGERKHINSIITIMLLAWILVSIAKIFIA